MYCGGSVCIAWIEEVGYVIGSGSEGDAADGGEVGALVG